MDYDHVSGEVVITATEFKAKCLELLDRVSSGDLKRVRITKRGKEVAVMEGPEPAGAVISFIGAQPDTVYLPPDLDIDGPIYDPERDGHCRPLGGF
jgi:prevent-host-death family protein